VKAYLTLLVGVVAMSFASIFIRLAGAPPLVIAAYRMTIASAVLLPITSRKSIKALKELPRADLLILLLSSALLAVHFWLWITSLSYTSIASSVILVASHPVFVAIIAYFLWGERLTKLMVLGVAVAFAGAVLINYGGFALSKTALLGDTLAVLAAIAMGAYLIIGRHVRARIDFLSYVTIIYTCAAVFLPIATVIAGRRLFTYSSQTYLMLVLIALVPQLIGHSSINFAVRLLPAIFVSVAILGEPVGATLLGYFILSEAPTMNEVAGGILVLAGIFAVLRKNPKQN